jgi:hypothetical protein
VLFHLAQKNCIRITNGKDLAYNPEIIAKSAPTQVLAHPADIIFIQSQEKSIRYYEEPF